MMARTGNTCAFYLKIMVLFTVYSVKVNSVNAVQIFPLDFHKNKIEVNSIEYGEIYTAELQYTNNSDKVVEIKSIKGSCGCITGETNKPECPPGGIGHISITYVATTIGEASYFVAVTTIGGESLFIPFEANVIRSFVWDDRATKFNAYFDQVPPQSELKIFYYGKEIKLVTLKDIRVEGEGYEVEILKRKWKKDEIPTNEMDVIDRHCFAEIIIRPLKDTAFFLGKKKNVKLIIVSEDKTEKQINIPINIRAKDFFRIYPNPIVKKVSINNNEFRSEEVITIESTDPLRKIERVMLTSPDERHISIGEIKKEKNGLFLVPCTFIYNCEETGLNKGDIDLSLWVGEYELSKKIGYTFLCHPDSDRN